MSQHQHQPLPLNPNNNTTRRDFLKSSAGVVTAAAVASAATNAFIARSAHAAGSDALKIALVGCGGRGGGAAQQAMSTSGETRLVAVADAFEGQARGVLQPLKDEFGGKVDVSDDNVFWGLDAYKGAVESDANVVILATPPGFRPMHFEAAVKAGKHVFMEKPVATDAPGVRQVLEANKIAKQKNLKVGVGLQRHHDRRYNEVIARIHDGAIGDVQLLRVYWNGDGVWVRPRRPEQTEMEYQVNNWYYFTWLSGDHIDEQHIHNLDVANWVMKTHPTWAQGQGGRQFRTGADHGEIYDHHMVEFTYGDRDSVDAVTMQSQCRHIPGTWSAVEEHAHGTKGYANISGGFIVTRDGKRWDGQGGANPYQVEHDVLFDAIRNDKPHNEADNGAISTMTAIMGRMATYSGQMLSWDQAFNSDLRLVPPAEEINFKAKPPVLPDENGRYPVPMPGQTRAF